MIITRSEILLTDLNDLHKILSGIYETKFACNRSSFATKLWYFLQLYLKSHMLIVKISIEYPLFWFNDFLSKTYEITSQADNELPSFCDYKYTCNCSQNKIVLILVLGIFFQSELRQDR